MENLIFSLNATLPIFLLMVLGYVFNKLHIIDEKAASWMNKFVFKVALPVLLFEDLAEQDFAGTWNGRFVLFCLLVTLLSILVITLISKLIIKNKAQCRRAVRARTLRAYRRTGCPPRRRTLQGAFRRRKPSMKESS